MTLLGDCEYPERGWPVNGGYIRILADGRQQYAHKWRWEREQGRPVRPGFELGHECHNPPCWRTDHLREMTHAENMLMRKERQTHCKRGHPLSGENMTVVNGRRRCKACARGYWHAGKPLRAQLKHLRASLAELDVMLTREGV